MSGLSRIIVIVISVLLVSSCSGGGAKPKEQDLVHVKPNPSLRTKSLSKKVILILVDSIMYQSIDDGMKQNKLPTLQYLINNGQYYKNVVSSFPTMSVAIDSSLLTGTYPDKHRVPGLTWYSARDNRMINYGTGPMEILKQGAGTVLHDAFINLNQQHLNPNTLTIYEDLQNKGYTSGSINGLIYRGTVNHSLSIPKWMNAPVSLPAEIKVKGPHLFWFGAFSNPLDGIKDLDTSITKRYGFNNDYAIEAATYLIQNKKLPDLLTVYLPDMDQKLHKKGPSYLDALVKVDQQLQTLLQAFGSPEEALKQANIIIVGDSGMSHILPADKKPVMDLSKILKKYKVLSPGATVDTNTQVGLAVNETMAYVYKFHTSDCLRKIAADLRQDARIDLLAWKEDGWIHVTQGGGSKQFKYKPSGDFADEYNQRWTVEGQSEVVDLQLNEAQAAIQYRKYPDVLRRIYGALHSHEGEFMVVTAKEGYELSGQSSPTHKNGGGHGGMHRSESLVPLIVCGTNEQPEQLRLVDLKSYLMKLITK